MKVHLYREAHFVPFHFYKCKFHYIHYKCEFHSCLICTRQVAKPQNVTRRYCFTPYQCTAAISTNYSLHFHTVKTYNKHLSLSLPETLSFKITHFFLERKIFVISLNSCWPGLPHRPMRHRHRGPKKSAPSTPY